MITQWGGPAGPLNTLAKSNRSPKQDSHLCHKDTLFKLNGLKYTLFFVDGNHISQAKQNNICFEADGVKLS